MVKKFLKIYTLLIFKYLQQHFKIKIFVKYNFE